MQKRFSVVYPSVSKGKLTRTKNLQSAATTNLIKDVIRNANEVRDKVIVIKLPSAVIEDDILLNNFIENVGLLQACGAKIFLVHDHTHLVKETLKSFGIEEKYIRDVLVTDYKSTQIIEMILSGHINKLIVSKLNKLGCAAIGISGKDGNLIQAKKSQISSNKAKNPTVIELGFISEPITINNEILLHFEDMGATVVISPVASDENGHTHLLDADLTAALISTSLEADYLVFSYEEKLLDIKKAKTTDIKALQKLLHNNHSSPKVVSLIEAAICAVANNTERIHFIKENVRDALLLSIVMNMNGDANDIA